MYTKWPALAESRAVQVLLMVLTTGRPVKICCNNSQSFSFKNILSARPSLPGVAVKQ